MPQTLADDEIAQDIHSLNSKQRKVFTVAHTWTKDYVGHNRDNVKPIHIFLLGSGGTGKSNLVKVMYHAPSKPLFCHCKDPEKPSVFSLGPTVTSTVNIGGATICSGFKSKPGSKLLGLNDISKAPLRYQLFKVKFLSIDEPFMVSSDSWVDTYSSWK